MTDSKGLAGHDTPNVNRLKAWAETKGFTVTVGSGSQREPENIVTVSNGGLYGGARLMTGSSLDSPDTAAMYVLNKLQALGVEIP